MNSDPELERLLSGARSLRASIDPPRDLWPDIAAGIARAGKPGAAVRYFRLQASGIAALLAASIVVLLGLAWWTRAENAARLSWSVASIAGAPRVGGVAAPARARLRQGDWLETDGDSIARISVGRIGEVSIQPNSRVRLLSVADNDNRLELARGELSAVVSAPPRLFFVETPSATAVDLGCAYTLSVDEAGNGTLSVTLGQVALAGNGKDPSEILVRAGMKCDLRRGAGPGTPYSAGASPALRQALQRYDFESQDALPSVLAMANRYEDAAMLVDMLRRAPPGLRGAIFDALARIVPPRAGVTRAGVVAGDRAMIDSWESIAIDPPVMKSKIAPAR